MSETTTNGKAGPAIPAPAARAPRRSPRARTRPKAPPVGFTSEAPDAPAILEPSVSSPIVLNPGTYVIAEPIARDAIERAIADGTIRRQEPPEIAATAVEVPASAAPILETAPEQSSDRPSADAAPPQSNAPADAPAPAEGGHADAASPAAPAPVEPPQGPPPIVWSIPLEQPGWPDADAELLPSLPSAVIYAPDVDKRPIKGLAFDYRSWGLGLVLIMKLAESRRVRLNDGIIVDAPAGATIVVPVVSDLEAIIPEMIKHNEFALEIEFAPVRVDLDAMGRPLVRFRCLQPKVTEIPRTAAELWNEAA